MHVGPPFLDEGNLTHLTLGDAIRITLSLAYRTAHEFKVNMLNRFCYLLSHRLGITRSDGRSSESTLQGPDRAQSVDRERSVKRYENQGA